MTQIESILQKRKQKKILLITTFIILTVIIVSEVVYRTVLFDASISIIKNLHVEAKETTNNISNTLISLSLRKEYKISTAIEVIRVISDIFSSYISVLIIFTFFYCFCNVYKAFYLIIIISYTIGIGGWFTIIYRQPMIYFSRKFYNTHISIDKLDCLAGWGNPSVSAMTLSAVGLYIYTQAINNSRLRNKTIPKILLLSITIIIILLINTSRFFGFIHALNQILYGSMLGMVIYFFFYYALQTNINNAKEFNRTIDYSIWYYLLSDLILAVIYIITHYANPKNKDPFPDKYNHNIDMHCSQIPDSLRFDNEAYMFYMIYFSKIGMIIGIKLEKKISFKNDSELFKLYNFEKDIDEIDTESLYSKNVFSQDTQWNHTKGWYQGTMRFLACLLVMCVFGIPMVSVSLSNGFVIVTVFKYFLPLFSVYFICFFLLKIMFRKFEWDNNEIFRLKNNDEFL